MDIKIKAKLKAYAKGNLPTKVSDLENDLDFISDVQDAEHLYVRKKGEWVNADDSLKQTTISTLSGLGIEHSDHHYDLWVKQEDLTQTEFENISVLEADTTYYIMDQTANTFDDGGTAFSNGDNEFVDLPEYAKQIDGGNASSVANIIMNPLDSKGVYNG